LQNFFRINDWLSTMHGSGASPKARDIAQHLIAYEAIEKHQCTTSGPAAFEVCEKLRRPLSTLTGTAGFRSLLVRALTLARREADTLDAVLVRDDGSLDGPAIDAAGPGGALLIAQLLGLLMTFIGEALTMSLLHEIWPELLTADLKPGKELV
jgi:hypothetical protein